MHHDQLTRPALRDVSFDMITYGANGVLTISGHNGSPNTKELDPHAIIDVAPLLDNLLADLEDNRQDGDMSGIFYDGRKYGVRSDRINGIEVLMLINLTDAPCNANLKERRAEANAMLDKIVAGNRHERRKARKLN